VDLAEAGIAGLGIGLGLGLTVVLAPWLLRRLDRQDKRKDT
jgi:hypothetical protein